MNFNDIINALASIELATGALGTGGILALLGATKAHKSRAKVALVLTAIVLLIGAVLWQMRRSLAA